MPIRVPNALPAVSVLEQENIFIMREDRAARQDIRPLRIAILNLMPKKSRQKPSCCGCWATHPSRWISS